MTGTLAENRTVLVAMSGGVDSSLAAVLLAEQGYNVIGMTMHLWDHAAGGGDLIHESACCSIEAADQARGVCTARRIPHYVADFRDEFRKEIVSNFIAEYLSGRTPNPCVLCNRRLKWEALLQKGRQSGAGYLATGHYARIGKDSNNGRYMLRRGIDAEKDQSYFLWMLTQPQLARTLFPLGEMTKRQTREQARVHQLKVSEKKDSQEICFIPDDDYRRFLEEMMGESPPMPGEGKEDAPPALPGPGPIQDSTGQVIGQHAGFPFYTVGQRRGLGVAVGHPLYVTRIDAVRNTVILGPEEDLYTDRLTASGLNWISIDEPQEPLHCTAQIRYRHTPAQAVLIPCSDGRATVHFDTPQRAITPGQSVVFYDGDIVLGGGLIEHVAPAS